MGDCTGDGRAVVEPFVQPFVETMQSRSSRRCRAVHRDGAEPSVETVQSRRSRRCRAVGRDDAEPSVEPFIETIIRLPGILVLHVSRALELQIGFK